MIRDFLRAVGTRISNHFHGDEYERATRQWLQEVETPRQHGETNSPVCRKMAARLNEMERQRGLPVADYNG